MTPTRRERIGRHEVTLFPDAKGSVAIAQIVWRGDVSVEEAREAIAVYGPHIGTCFIYVTDLSRLGKMPMDAMRILGGSTLEHTSAPRHFRLAYAVPNLRTRVLMQLIISTATLLASDKVETAFFDSLAEAMTWAEAQMSAG